MREYPGRLHHNTPGWVKDGAIFHLRIRAGKHQQPLTAPQLATDLLAAVRRYHDLGYWWCELFLFMPDHAHALLAFPAEPGMSETLRNWKRGTTRFQHVDWQDGYFDHRLRDNESVAEAWHYIRRNPVVKGLCATEDDWPWWWSGIVPNPKVERVDPNALSGLPNLKPAS
jgi:REP element-mobilizing transposase RayT